MRWEKYKVPLLQLGLIVTAAVAIISLASVFILNARLKNMQTEQVTVRENSAARERQALEQQLMVYGSPDAKALVMRGSHMLQGLSGDEILFNRAEGVFAANDADGRYYIWRMSDGELLSTYANNSYDRALLIGQNKILLEDNGYFYCFDYTSGMQLWKWQFPYEDCLWQYNEASGVIYIMSTVPDKVTQTVMTAGTRTDEDDWDDWDDNNRSSQTEEILVSLSHDIYVLSLDELTVNYIRPNDLLEEETNYDSLVISDMTLSEDCTKLLINGCVSDDDMQYDRYFSRIYYLDEISFVAEGTSDQYSDNEDGEANQEVSAPQTSGIVKEARARYDERSDTGWRMLSRWIDNDSLIQYSEEIVTRDTSNDEEEHAEEDGDSDNRPGSNSVAGKKEIDELDAEPDTVTWSIRKRTLPYASTSWRMTGSGAPSDNFRLYRYEANENTYLILALSQCVLTLGSNTGQEISRVYDTDAFVYIEPKQTRPTMYITDNGTVIQGKRHYGLGVSDISAVARFNDTYYVSAGNSIYLFTMAENVAQSGTVLSDSDEIIWDKAVISSDGKFAAVSGKRYLRLYSTENGSRIYQNICAKSIGIDAIFSENRLCHLDASGNHFMIYDADTGTKDQISLSTSTVAQMSQIRSYGPQYALLASEDGQSVWIVDTKGKSISRSFKKKDFCDAAGLDAKASTIEYCRMSPDMHYMVFSARVSDEAGSLTLKAFIMDLETAKVVQCDDLVDCLDVVPDELPRLCSSANAFSQDGKYALFLDSNNSICVFDLARAACIYRRNCGELSAGPAFAQGNYVVCVSKAGDVYMLNPTEEKFVAVDEEGDAILSDDPFSMDRPGTNVTLSFDQTSSKMYAQGLKNGAAFVRVYSISGDGVLTPETEIPSAVTCDAGLVLMRYGDSAAELFRYLSMDELKAKAAGSVEQG